MLCLLKSPFLLPWLMLQRAVDTLLDDDVRPPLIAPDLARACALARRASDVRALIRTMSEANPLWGAPRIHGELLKLGIEVGQASVAKSMVRRHQPPSRTWRSFLRNHMSQMMTADPFVVPTATYRLLFVLIILAHDRRRIVHVAVTAHPIIGSVRRECLDHVIILNAAGLRRVLNAYVEYDMASRTHLALEKDAPLPRPVALPTAGRVVAIPQVGGLHHRYERRAA